MFSTSELRVNPHAVFTITTKGSVQLYQDPSLEELVEDVTLAQGTFVASCQPITGVTKAIFVRVLDDSSNPDENFAWVSPHSGYLPKTALKPLEIQDETSRYSHFSISDGTVNGPLFTHDPCIDDIRQSTLNCGFYAGLISLATTNWGKEKIKAAFQTHNDGTVTVTLSLKNSSGQFQHLGVRVNTNSITRRIGNQPALGNLEPHSIANPSAPWVRVLEVACMVLDSCYGNPKLCDQRIYDFRSERRIPLCNSMRNVNAGVIALFAGTNDKKHVLTNPLSTPANGSTTTKFFGDANSEQTIKLIRDALKQEKPIVASSYPDKGPYKIETQEPVAYVVCISGDIKKTTEAIFSPVNIAPDDVQKLRIAINKIAHYVEVVLYQSSEEIFRTKYLPVVDSRLLTIGVLTITDPLDVECYQWKLLTNNNNNRENQVTSFLGVVQSLRTELDDSRQYFADQDPKLIVLPTKHAYSVVGLVTKEGGKFRQVTVDGLQDDALESHMGAILNDKKCLVLLCNPWKTRQGLCYKKKGDQFVLSSSLTVPSSHVFPIAIKDFMTMVRQLTISGHGEDALRQRNDNGSKFRRAAADGNLNVLKQLLASVVNVNAPSTNGRTALHWACIKGHSDCVTILLADNRTNPDTLDRDGHSPLISAIIASKIKCAIALINVCCDLSGIDKDGRNVFDLLLQHQQLFGSSRLIIDLEQAFKERLEPAPQFSYPPFLLKHKVGRKFMLMIKMQQSTRPPILFTETADFIHVPCGGICRLEKDKTPDNIAGLLTTRDNSVGTIIIWSKYRAKMSMINYDECTSVGDIITERQYCGEGYTIESFWREGSLPSRQMAALLSKNKSGFHTLKSSNRIALVAGYQGWEFHDVIHPMKLIRPPQVRIVYLINKIIDLAYSQSDIKRQALLFDGENWCPTTDIETQLDSRLKYEDNSTADKFNLNIDFIPNLAPQCMQNLGQLLLYYLYPDQLISNMRKTLGANAVGESWEEIEHNVLIACFESTSPKKAEDLYEMFMGYCHMALNLGGHFFPMIQLRPQASSNGMDNTVSYTSHSC